MAKGGQKPAPQIRRACGWIHEKPSRLHPHINLLTKNLAAAIAQKPGGCGVDCINKLSTVTAAAVVMNLKILTQTILKKKDPPIDPLYVPTA